MKATKFRHSAVVFLTGALFAWACAPAGELIPDAGAQDVDTTIEFQVFTGTCGAEGFSTVLDSADAVVTMSAMTPNGGTTGPFIDNPTIWLDPVTRELTTSCAEGAPYRVLIGRT